jgi:hypothetical protein
MRRAPPHDTCNEPAQLEDKRRGAACVRVLLLSGPLPGHAPLLRSVCVLSRCSAGTSAGTHMRPCPCCLMVKPCSLTYSSGKSIRVGLTALASLPATTGTGEGGAYRYSSPRNPSRSPGEAVTGIRAEADFSGDIIAQLPPHPRSSSEASMVSFVGRRTPRNLGVQWGFQARSPGPLR